MAQQDIDNGPGVLAVQAPQNDPSVPGGKVSTLVIDDSAVQPLRDALTQLFDLGDRGGHAVVLLNPSATVPAGCVPGSGQPCCSSGPGHICLQLHRVADVDADSIELLPGTPSFPFDPGRVDLPFLGGTFLTSAFVPLDLTAFDAAGNVDTSSSLGRLTTLFAGADTEIRLKLHPAGTHVESRHGLAGLWIPAELNFLQGGFGPEIHIQCKEVSGGPVEGDLPDCAKIIAKMNDGIRDEAGLVGKIKSAFCHTVDVYAIVNRIHFWLGLIPDAPAGCNPLAFRSDLDWMKNTLNGRAYHQGCMRVSVDFAAYARVEASELINGYSGDVGVSAFVSQCSAPVKEACSTIVDCPAKATEIAAKELGPRIGTQVQDVMNERIAPFLTYSGGPGSPYLSPSAPGGACNPLQDAACQARVRQHDLPASLTRLVYGWFGNAFGDFTQVQTYDYPVARIDTPVKCPPGHPLVEALPKADECSVCIGTTCLPTLEIPPPGRIIDFDYALDPDGDGVLESNDNCPGKYNAKPPGGQQKDTDGDGLGDACDPCPCDAMNDEDHDGVCASYSCPGNGDNCPKVANPLQENCNLDSERADGGEILGDACDPVPCPLFTPQFFFAGLPVAGTKPDADITVTKELTFLAFSPVGSHVRSPATKDAVEVAAPVPSTQHRYCIDNQLATGVSCFEPFKAINDGLLTKNLKDIYQPSQAAEDTFSLWHRVSFYQQNADSPDGARTYQTGSKYGKAWQYKDDFAYWLTTPWGATWVPDLAALMSSNTPFDFDGRFWAHGDTHIGTMDDSLSTGIHAIADANDNLANHYEPLTPFMRYVIKAVPQVKWPLLVRDCIFCGGTLGITRQCLACGVEAPTEGPLYISKLLAVQADGTVSVASAAGGLLPLRAPIAPHLAQSLTEDLLWVNQAEPSTDWGLGTRGPMAVALSVDGSEVAEQAFAAAGQLFAAEDLGRIGRIGQSPTPALGAASAVPQSPAQTFEAVYSRATGEMFVVTSGAASSGQSSLRRLKLSEGVWEPVPPGGYAAGQVQAATYSFFEKKLWILDDVDVPGQNAKRHRIVVVDPETGAAQILAAAPHLGLYQDYWLRVDRDGSMLLFASSSVFDKHAIVRLHAAQGKLEILGVRFGPGWLAAPPAVDSEGYWLVTQHGKKVARPERLDDLGLTLPSSLDAAEWM